VSAGKKLLKLLGLDDEYKAIADRVAAALGPDPSPTVARAALRREGVPVPSQKKGAPTSQQAATPPKRKATTPPTPGRATTPPKPKPKAETPLAVKPQAATAPRPERLEGAESPFMVSTRRPSAPNYATFGNPELGSARFHVPRWSIFVSEGLGSTRCHLRKPSCLVGIM
jgi:hypothetical protein